MTDNERTGAELDAEAGLPPASTSSCWQGGHECDVQ